MRSSGDSACAARFASEDEDAGQLALTAPRLPPLLPLPPPCPAAYVRTEAGAAAAGLGIRRGLPARLRARVRVVLARVW